MTAAQVCSNTTAHVIVSSHAKLKIDIHWLHIHDVQGWDKTVHPPTTFPHYVFVTLWPGTTVES